MSDSLDVLIEVGAEEIPDRFLPEALAELRRRFEQLLQTSVLPAASVETHGAPRRLAIVARQVRAKQEDRSEELLGPPVASAYQDGKPTPAAVGFAKKAGVDPSQLRRVATDKGERVGATRQVPGRSLSDVLADEVPRLFETLPWPKNMRWGDGRHAWVRPVHWIVAVAGSDVVPLDAFGIHSGRVSRGHRTLSPGAVAIRNADAYFDSLRGSHVLVDREARKAVIRQGLASRAMELDGEVVPDAPLIETTCDLTEWPVVIAGKFPAKYLELPDVVLSTAMRVHQKFFALVDARGKLLPAFLHVANQEDADGTIARNAASVLTARLDDASFFWERDRQRPLESRVDELAHVLFQDKLGSYLDKVRRMERLAVRALPLAGLVQLHEVEDLAALLKSVELCKADQCTEMVREFSELQGVMGGIYLKLEGYGDDTCRAVEEHYLPASLTDPVPSTPLGALLSVVDKMDTLVGCFGTGVVPTGSKDPFGLRRAAQGMLRALLEGGIDVPLPELLDASAEIYDGVPGFERQRVQDELVPYLEGRLRFLLTEGVALKEGGAFFPADEVSAVIAASWERLPDLLSRLRALSAVRGAERRGDFEALSVSFKRVRNIVRTARSGKDEARAEAPQLTEPAEIALSEALRAVTKSTAALLERRDHAKALEELAGLRPHVDRFFDEVLVMAEDPKVRAGRIGLLEEIERLFLRVADVSEIVVPG